MDTIKRIGYVRSDFPTKFGIPRQSGLVDTRARVIFVPPYNQPDAVRGLEEFSHIWLIWEFSKNTKKEGEWSATVRPPRLGGNVREGVFATRSPYRPNPIGLSCVRLEEITMEKEGPVLHIIGGDMADGTPVLDVKPYLPYADCHPEAAGGFTDKTEARTVDVVIPEEIEKSLPAGQCQLLRDILAQDPRPSYQDDAERIYGMEYAGMEIRFTVREGILTVRSIENASKLR